MNHDYAHCADYNEEMCTVRCFRAELVIEYRKRVAAGEMKGIPVSWMYLRETDSCPLNLPRKTNGDRIRAGTDEYIVDVILNECTGRRCLKSDGTLYSDCRTCWLDWLKQPAESEVDNGKA